MCVCDAYIFDLIIYLDDIITRSRQRWRSWSKVFWFPSSSEHRERFSFHFPLHRRLPEEIVPCRSYRHCNYRRYRCTPRRMLVLLNSRESSANSFSVSLLLHKFTDTYLHRTFGIKCGHLIYFANTKTALDAVVIDQESS